MATKEVTIDHTQIVVDRQSLLDLVRAYDTGSVSTNLPFALDRLREPFFTDEMSSGNARSDFSVNSYK